MKKSLFDYTESKNKKSLFRTTLLIFCSIVVLNGAIFSIYMTLRTMDNNILNNKSLSLISLNGYDKEGNSYPYDIERLSDLENVEFVVKSQPIGLGLTINGDLRGDLYGIFIHCMNPKFSEYINIEHMEDWVIYIPKDSKDEVEPLPNDLKTLRPMPPLDKLPLVLERTNTSPPLAYYGDAFVTEFTYEKMRSLMDEEDFGCIQIEYLIGVDKPENVYKVVNAIRALYKDDDEGIFYQAQGLEKMISDTKTTIIVQVILLVVLTSFLVFILHFSGILLTRDIMRDMMIFYLNGMSRANICKEYGRFILKKILPPLLLGASFSILGSLIAFHKAYPLESFNPSFIFVLIIANLLIALLVISLLNIFMKKNIYKGTDAEKVSQLLRN